MAQAKTYLKLSIHKEATGFYVEGNRGTVGSGERHGPMSESEANALFTKLAGLRMEPPCDSCGAPRDMPGFRDCSECASETVDAIVAGEY